MSEYVDKNALLEWSEGMHTTPEEIEHISERTRGFDLAMERLEDEIRNGRFDIPSKGIEEYYELQYRYRQVRSQLDRISFPNHRIYWNEEHGPVLWWKFPIEEPPYCGTPLDDGWPGYHTHWTTIVLPAIPTLQNKDQNGKVELRANESEVYGNDCPSRKCEF